MNGFAIRREIDTAHVALAGKPDREALRACAADLAREIEGGARHLEFDLTDASGLDAAAAVMMLRAAAAVRRSAGGIRVLGGQGAVAEALRLLDLGAGA